jgi:membrane associated rhomboid family serine protease
MFPLRDSVPVQRWPVVTWLLIGMNVWAFLNELLLGPELEAFVRTWGFVPARHFAMAELNPEDWVGRYLPIFTSMFLHGGWLHLLGNMLYLYIFGDNVEDRLGHLRYLVFYLACGVGAALVHAHLAPDSTIPTVGASGAISGVLGAYFVLFPYARVYTLVPFVFVFLGVVEIPAGVYLGLWFAMQLLNGAVGLAVPVEVSGGVAWWAHIGGFAMGTAVASLLLIRRRERRRWRPEYAPW